MKSLLLILSVFILNACQTTSQNYEKPHPSEMKVTTFEEDHLGLKITNQGHNVEAAFSPDGNKICFVSNSRFAHKNRQLYEFTLSSRTERRVSFSDGDVFLPIYSFLGDVIIYSSTTDEMKERPLLFYPNKYQYRIPKDIYTSDPFGKHIERILNSEGSQSDLHLVNGTHDEYTYISSVDEQSKIIKFNIHSKSENILKTFTKFEPKRPLANKKGELFWLQDDKIQKYQVGKEVQTLKIPLRILDFEWAIPEKNMIVFLAQNERQESIVSILNEKQSCIAQVFTTNRKVTSVDYSEKGNKLLLTVEDDDQNHIYVRELRASDIEALACDAIE